MVCDFFNTRDTGTIELKKAWSGTAGQTTLNIGTTVDGTDVASQLTGAAGADPLTTGTQGVDTGTYYVSETGGLAGYASGLACTRDGQAFTPGANGAVAVGADEVIVCTFTNTRDTGTITVVKDFVGTAGLVDLLVDGSIEATDQGDGGSTGAIPVDTGTRTAGEAAGTGTDLAAYTSTYSCTEDSNTASPITGSGTTTGDIPVEAGDAWTCTFTNTRDTGTITVVKDFVGTAGLVDLLVDGNTEATDQGDGGSTGAIPVDTGTRTASEAAGDGTDLADYSSTYSCTEDSNAASPITGSGTTTGDIPVEAGDAWTCTFTNTQRGTIVIEKATDPAGVDQDFAFTNTIGIGGFTLNAGDPATASRTVSDLEPGPYEVSEVVPAGWDLGDISCDDDDSTGDTDTATATFDVAAGETVTCTFTNTELATLTIAKVTDPVDSGADSFDFIAPSTGLSNFTLDTNAGDATYPSERTFTFGSNFGVKNLSLIHISEPTRLQV